MNMTLRSVLFAVLLSSVGAASMCDVSMQENLAPAARITSNSQYSGDYLAKFVADGWISAAGASNDQGKAWCVKGDTHRNGAELTFEWDKSVRVAEIIYYGRTAWFLNECWKDYEIYLDNSTIAATLERLRDIP